MFSSFSVQHWRNTISALGPLIEEHAGEAMEHEAMRDRPANQLKREGFHITILATFEVRSLAARPPQKALDRLASALPISLGPGGKGEVAWVVILWRAAAAFRKDLGLPPKDFHITLTLLDNHEVAKGYATLFYPRSLHTTLEGLEQLAEACYAAQDYDKSFEMAEVACRTYPEAARAWYRLGEAALAMEMRKLAMLAYGRTLHLIPADASSRPVAICLKKMDMATRPTYDAEGGVISKGTEWGAIFHDAELDELPKALRLELLRPYNADVRSLIGHYERSQPPTYSAPPREHALVPLSPDGREMHSLPRNTS